MTVHPRCCPRCWTCCCRRSMPWVNTRPIARDPICRRETLSGIWRIMPAMWSSSACARPEGEALLTAALIALLSSGSFYVGDGLPALLAGVPSADLRDEQGVPLIVHAVLKGPTDWVRRLLEKASPAARLSQNALLAGEWGTLEFAAGLDAKEAATRAIAAIEERQISGGNAPVASGPHPGHPRQRGAAALAVLLADLASHAVGGVTRCGRCGRCKRCGR